MNPFSVFSKDKSFSLPVIGNVTLNKLGLHTLRIYLSDLFLAFRRLQTSGLSRSAEYEKFKQDGVLVLENFLPDDEFSTLLEEVKAQINTMNTTNPIRNYGEEGFGSKHYFKNADDGFDRYDGDTLNRFYTISSQLPASLAFINHPRLKALTSLLAGAYHDGSKYLIYLLNHGKNTTNTDSQKNIHRDTFHSAIKLWYFLEDVEDHQGPFHYAPGTNIMTPQRLQWEKERSIQASKDNAGGAFRISTDDLNSVSKSGIKSYPVKKNTLVIADIRGFHSRGMALEGSTRLSIYANMRPSPFLPALPTAMLKKLKQKLIKKA